MSIINPDYAAKLVAANPHLIEARDWKGSRQALAAKNIRTELKRAFPGQKFSVTSDSFSMGDSVDVRWTDGPTTDEINAIIGKYVNSAFDGMTDSSSPVHNDWHVFGETKYAHSHREISPEWYIEIAVEMGCPDARYERGEIVGHGINSNVSQQIMREARLRSYYTKPAVLHVDRATGPDRTGRVCITAKGRAALAEKGIAEQDALKAMARNDAEDLAAEQADLSKAADIAEAVLEEMVDSMTTPADEPVTPHPIGIDTFWCITVVNGHVECFETSPVSLMYQTLGGLKPDDLDSCYLTEKDARTAAAMLTRELAETAVRLAERALAEATARLHHLRADTKAGT